MCKCIKYNIHIYVLYIYTRSKVWDQCDFFYVFNGVSFCSSSIYLIKNTEKTVILWNFIAISNIGFLFKYTLKYNVFLWCSAEFVSAITPVFSVTWSFGSPSNILIYYQCTQAAVKKADYTVMWPCLSLSHTTCYSTLRKTPHLNSQ